MGAKNLGCATPNLPRVRWPGSQHRIHKSDLPFHLPPQRAQRSETFALSFRSSNCAWTIRLQSNPKRLTKFAVPSWHPMSNSTMLNISKQPSSICPTFVALKLLFSCIYRPLSFYCSNGRQTVGDGAFSSDMTPSVIAVCHVEGTDSIYYYSTTFSGGPGVRFHSSRLRRASLTFCTVAFLTSLTRNALLIEGRQTG